MATDYKSSLEKACGFIREQHLIGDFARYLVRESAAMTREEFAQQYAESSGLSVRRLSEQGFLFVRCSCGEEGCLGWAAASALVLQQQVSLGMFDEEEYRAATEFAEEQIKRNEDEQSAQLREAASGCAATWDLPCAKTDNTQELGLDKIQCRGCDGKGSIPFSTYARLQCPGCDGRKVLWAAERFNHRRDSVTAAPYPDKSSTYQREIAKKYLRLTKQQLKKLLQEEDIDL